MHSFTVPDMTCGHCVGVINDTLTKLDPLCEIEFDLVTHSIQVTSDSSQQELSDALTEAGYPPAA